jgi:trigger factor
MHGEQLEQDAESEAVREMLDAALAQADIKADELLGDPTFKKYEKIEGGIEVEVEISTKPSIDLGDYKKLVPAYERPTASDEEVAKRVETLAEQAAPLESITEDRALENGDTAQFDFEGFLDGEPFEGGKADDFELEIGTNQFIAGFEEQMLGMKKGEQKRIEVTFPEDYQAENLKGKKTEFDINLKDIKTKGTPELNDDLAKKITNQDDATVDSLKERTAEQIVTEEISKAYNDELKPKLLEALVAGYEFDLPRNILEQEIDNLLNQKAQTMTPDEIKEVQENSEKLQELRESVRDDAINSVKATFIVDAIAKEEKVAVSDEEVYQALYYEAMMGGQKPEEVVDYYKKNNLIPAIKMGMIEDKLFGQLLELDKKED